MYVAATAEILSSQPAIVAEARAEQARQARAKKLAKKSRCRPDNPLLNHPHPDWRDGGFANGVFGEYRESPHRARQSMRAVFDDDSAPVAQLKRALAGNFMRVVDLFRQWDVDCDGLISTQELRDAIGALRLHGDHHCADALFASLDKDGSGKIEFQELHYALRKFNPPPLTVVLEQPAMPVAVDKVAARCPPRPRILEREAVRAVKRQLAIHQSRVADLFRRWDYDDSRAISLDELKRALAALSIEIAPHHLKMLFDEIDADGSGEISYAELHHVLRRQVDRDTGGNQIFDAATGTYTTAGTKVRQRQTVSLPAIRTSTSVAVVDETSIVPTDALKAADFAAGREKRGIRDLNRGVAIEKQAAATRAAHGV